ncbi:MAG: YkvA family protein [Woeseiaceae bacterium]
MRISFELDDSDLKHFQLIMDEARKSARRIPPEDIVAAAEHMLRNVPRSGSPGFIVERLDRLQTMITMLSDVEWRLPHQDASRVLNALAYFAEPEDLIPDHIPGLGFLDDAIMIELVARELRHEIEAYQDFCDYREPNSRPVVVADTDKRQPHRGIQPKACRVIPDQRIETCCRDSGHTDKQEQTGEQRVELALQARILVAEHEHDEDHRGQTERDCERRPENDESDDGQWSHGIISETVYI